MRMLKIKHNLLLRKVLPKNLIFAQIILHKKNLPRVKSSVINILKIFISILFSILKNGISPQPFLWPAFKIGRKKLEQEITDYINNFGLDE